jgi:hypothetical protein
MQDAWYEVRTAINNREPLFQQRQTIAIFCRIFYHVDTGAVMLLTQSVAILILETF